jgi:hypothetical protein
MTTRSALRLVIATLAGLPFALCASVIVTVPSDSLIPTWFSGTNCVASGKAQSTDGTITRAELYIGGILVRVWPEENFGQQFVPGPLILSAVFSSTHFDHMTDLEIKLRAWDSKGHYGEGSEEIRVYNKACIYGRNDFETKYAPGGVSVTPVGNALTAMNHDTGDSVTELGWSRFQIMDDIAECTAFHVATHGSYYSFASDFDEFDPDVIWERVYPSIDYAPDQNPAFGPFILDTRQAAVGTGTPPYNSGIPPVNIAFVYSCGTGTYNVMANAFLWPYYFYSAVDQAMLGWAIEAAINKINVASTAFWESLADTKTAVQARQITVDAYFGQEIEFPEQYMHLWGDFYARLYGVYTSSNYLPTTIWYDY